MFLHLLDNTQQKAFLALAKQFIEADSKLSDEEHNLLEMMYAETGQDLTPLPSELTGELDRLFSIGDEPGEAGVEEAAAPEEPALPEGDLETLAAAFETAQSRSVVLLEIIGVGHADADFSPEESDFVRRLATAFGISDAKVGAMESWVTRQMALAQEVEQFWAD